ncbi:BRO family protein [Paenibacillus sp. TC-CSREp1]|uniref:BRO family protein n=1 Tax=Paenibacillus sp. TC-CSREp1 TaxID=3410089 RepID=UPI003CF60CC1
MAQLTRVFNYGDWEVRTVLIKGESWFVAKDVCRVIGVSNPTVAVQRLDEDEVTKFNLGGLHGETNVVNEPGVYTLILGSRKPEAREFKRWITHEVIPTIRKTGGYVANDELFIETYLPHADETTRLLFRTTLDTVRKQNEQIAVLKPKADKYDEFLDSEGYTTFTTIGKHFLGGVSPQKLSTFLREQGVLYKRKVDGVYPPRQGLEKYFRVFTFYRDGWIAGRSVKVTPEGIDYVVSLYREKAEVA